MKTTIDFRKSNAEGEGKRDSVKVELSLKEEQKGPVFSATCTVFDSHGRDIIMDGQCFDTVLEQYGDQLERKELFAEIVELWKRNHLNNMHAGTREQEDALNSFRKAKGANYCKYSEEVEFLKEKGLYEVELKGKPYEYGSSWLYWQISESDLGRIKDIISESGTPPAP